jgi:hypothetical protein
VLECKHAEIPEISQWMKYMNEVEGNRVEILTVLYDVSRWLH